MVPLLECRGLACGYHGKTVLEGLDLSVRPGESVALLGPNGSGKSTLLRTIAKTLAAIRGEVRLQGRSVASLSHTEVARLAAFVPQEEATDFPFLVREIVAMGRIAHGTGLAESPEDVRLVEAAMETADCASLADRPITELSGGEKQRVWIARALAQESSLLLLDEPTSHLDVRHQLDVARLLAPLAAGGRGVLAAVHDLNLAAQIADRGILLHHGRAVLDAPMTEILRSPELDRVYGVKFVRTEESGVLRVFATVLA